MLVLLEVVLGVLAVLELVAGVGVVDVVVVDVDEVLVLLLVVVVLVLVLIGRKCGSISTSLPLKLENSSRSCSINLAPRGVFEYRSAASSMSSLSTTSLFCISSRSMEMCRTSPYMRFINP